MDSELKEKYYTEIIEKMINIYPQSGKWTLDFSDTIRNFMINYYHEHILSVESECIKNKSNTEELKNSLKNKKNLIYILGKSFELFFLTITLYPETLDKIYILTELDEVENNSDISLFKQNVKQFKNNLSPKIEYIYITGSENDMFNKVNNILTNNSNSIEYFAMDITGGKKPLVNSAYLIAAHTGIDMFYMDFDKYDTLFSRPELGSGFYRKVKNPLKGILYDQIQYIYKAYESGNFQSASLYFEKIRFDFIDETIKPKYKKLKLLIDALYHIEARKFDIIDENQQDLTKLWGFKNTEHLVELCKICEISANNIQNHNNRNSILKEFYQTIYENPDNLKIYYQVENAFITHKKGGNRRERYLRICSLIEIIFKGIFFNILNLKVIRNEKEIKEFKYNLLPKFTLGEARFLLDKKETFNVRNKKSPFKNIEINEKEKLYSENPNKKIVKDINICSLCNINDNRNLFIHSGFAPTDNDMHLLENMLTTVVNILFEDEIKKMDPFKIPKIEITGFQPEIMEV